jgi:hypothetical protein
MEPYPQHYSHRPRSIKSTDPSIRTMIDELQLMMQHLGEKVEGCCDRLDTRVDVVEQRFKERFIALEMARTEADVELVDQGKHVTDLKLEVTRLNRFMERENLTNLQGRSSILTTNESAPTGPAPTTNIDGPDGHRSDLHARDREFGMMFTQTLISANGTPYPRSFPHAVETASNFARNAPNSSHFDSVRSS